MVSTAADTDAVVGGKRVEDVGSIVAVGSISENGA